MTRQEQLRFCRKCLNRKLDVNQGLICNLTAEKADFESDCPDFHVDESVKEPAFQHQQEVPIEDIAHILPAEVLEKLKSEQNLPLGIIAASIIGLVGALIWSIITLKTGYQIGYMALAIGAGVGFGMRIFGKGIDNIFGFWGATIALFSCVLGNFLSVLGFLAEKYEIPFTDIFLSFNYGLLPVLMLDTFSFMDLLFYGFALFEGYKFSFRQFSDEDIRG